ncbi:AAA family ATPase [Candidatus Pacearchaeota archaeon]|nr:AAA family ATPase [Candidatus Pacearchaeota archaeon]
MIIGLTGTLGAGKGTIVNFLKQNSFEHYSVREFLIEEIKKRDLPINRDSMVLVANQLREMNSPSYIIEELSKKAKQEKGNIIIESIRTPEEAKKIKEMGGYLIAVDASPQIRYSRILLRKSETDKRSYDEFMEDEKREMFSTDPNKQNLSECIKRSDYIIQNNKSYEELEEKTKEIIKKIKELQNNISSKIPRPTWDEYFMKTAALVAERSTCLRHHVGAVIVKDKRIITTGYNGAAKGVKDCLELGCLRNELKIPSGTRHEICRAIHAEQNAIIQGAFHGISLKDSTLYCTHTPCMICAKMIVNSGIDKIVSYQDYPDESAKKFLEEAKVDLIKVQKPKQDIEFKD